MSNHFHLLLRVPHRPEMADGGPSLEELLAKLQKAVGAEQMKLVRLQLERAKVTWELIHFCGDVTDTEFRPDSGLLATDRPAAPELPHSNHVAIF